MRHSSPVRHLLIRCAWLALAGVGTTLAHAQNIAYWDTPQGVACIDRWVSYAMARLNSYKGGGDFERRKPWSINRYGILEARGLQSVAAPDDFRNYNNNRHWYIYAHYQPSPYSGWRIAEWNGAQITGVQTYVASCYAGSTAPPPTGPGPGAGPPTRPPGSTGATAPPPAGNDTCGFSLGSGILDRYRQLGGRAGFLGCPTRNESEAGRSPAGTQGAFAEFAGGDGGYLIWHRTGRLGGRTLEVHGCIYKLYRQVGGTTSWLGFPVSDEYDVQGGRRSDFEGGYVFWDRATARCQAYRYPGSTPTPPTPQPTTPQTPPVVQGPAGYIGCFKDDWTRDLNGPYTETATNTPRQCIATCSQRGFAYAGVQYSAHCFCGNSYGRYGPASNCDMRCSGDKSQLCGGTWANQVYRTSASGTAPPPPPANTPSADCAGCARDRCQSVCGSAIILLCVVSGGPGVNAAACESCMRQQGCK